MQIPTTPCILEVDSEYPNPQLGILQTVYLQDEIEPAQVPLSLYMQYT